MGLIKSAAKLGIGGAVVYTTVQQSLWHNQEKTIEAYSRLKSKVPGLNEYTKKIPSIVLTKQEIVTYWNSGVKLCFIGLAALPLATKKQFWKGFEYVKKSVKKSLAS